MEKIPDSTKFLANVLEATRRNAISWENTADPRVLIGQLEGPYSVKLEEVPDFDDGNEESPDYILSLQRIRRTAIRIDRRDVSDQELNLQVLSPFVSNPHEAFRDIWKRAYAKANKVQEVEEANKILEKMISDNIPF
jgi:hypothetical protein